MSQLVFIENNQVVTDSLTVAEVFGKRHDTVLRDIRNLGCSNEFNLHNFAEVDYTDERNRTYRKFVIKRDGLAFLVMGYTGAKAAEFKEKYIQEFNRMEEQLRNNVKVLDERSALIQSLKLTAETAERTDEIEKIITVQHRKILEIESKVDEQITLDYGEQRRLQKGVATKVYEICNDPKERPKFFRELYREIKDRFGVASYKDVKRKELQSALRYIESWIPRKVS